MTDIQKPKPPIINAHVHTFTLDHVPDRFLPLGLSKILASRSRGVATHIASGLGWLHPFSNSDRFSRFADFLKTSAGRTQTEVFEEVLGFYPKDTKFVVLPMDMAFMGAGEPKVTIESQHRELEELALKYPNNILPFVAVDPRRFSDADELLEKAKVWLEKRHDGQPVFRGIKLYPPQGYSCADPKFEMLFGYCEERGFPLMVHCSRGGVHTREIPMGRRQKEIEKITDPDVYRDICKRFPKLRICLAHFGGDEDWKMYFDDPKSRQKIDLDLPAESRVGMNWLTKIIQMIESDEFPNLYTDISYTVFNIDRHLSTLSVLLRGSSKLRKKVIFGSDYYMTHKEKFDERYLSMKLRHELGEDLFDEIGRKNPARYLGMD